MSAVNDDCSWYVITELDESDEEVCQTPDRDERLTSRRIVSFSNPVTGNKGALPRPSVVSWNIDDDLQIDRSTQHVAKNVGGMRKASVAMATGLAGIQSSRGVGLVDQVIVSTPGKIAMDNRSSSILKELQHALKLSKRNEQVQVFVHTVFLKVGEIDTVNETFAADVYIQARWREPLFDNQTELIIKDIDWSTYWNPNLYVDNCAAQLKENIWHTVMFNANMEAFVFERRRVSGKFNEKLELYQFPFDTQHVTVRLVSERSVREVSLEDDSGELSTVNAQSFVDEQEWRLYSNVETQQETVVRIYQGDNCFRPSFIAQCYASRRFGFYVWNIMFVMFFISGMAFGSFSVDWVKRENRLQLGYILLLTTITFKFAASSSLPRISYLTYLDKYILFSMIMLGTICVWHAILPSIHNIIDTNADSWALIALGSFFLLSHVTFFVIIYVKAIRRRNAFIEKEKLHKEKIKERQRAESIVEAINNNRNPRRSDA